MSDKNAASKWRQQFQIREDQKVSYRNFRPDSTPGLDGKEEALALLNKNIPKINDLQERLYAEGKQALLVVLQAMDTGGKDGTIRAVFGPLNPQGVHVSNFKAPCGRELAHDYLWRVHQAVPAKGMIGIFNRSHYEDVLIAKVRELAPKNVIKQRYRQINDFEAYLGENHVRIIKFHLCISKDEQRERLLSRLHTTEKNWKFSRGDLAERALWDDYENAYERVLKRCSPANAPWYVIPANKKWYRNAVVSQIILDTLRDMKPQFPAAEADLDQVVID